MKALTTVTLLLLFVLLGKENAYSQQFESSIDTIKTNVIYPKRNPLITKGNSYFVVKKKPLPFNLIHRKVNYWKTTSTVGVNLNQAAFSDNWSSGGVNSIALGGQLNYKSEYNKSGKNFTTDVVLQYGKIKNKDQLEKKTNDRIFWDNKASLPLSKNWNFFGSISFESQFDLGYIYKKVNGEEVRTVNSKFLSPGYLTESVGVEYSRKKYFSLRFGTGTARQSIMLDTSLHKFNKNFHKKEGDSVIIKGDKIINELAFQLVANFEKEIFTNINLKSRYLLFASYEKINNIDQRLDVTVTAKVNKLINVTVATVALYDDDWSGKIQSSQSLALGLVYKLSR